MRLEVGQFIRTPYGIRKIVDITKDEGYGKPRVRVIKLDDFLNTGYKFNYEFYTDEKIIKECKSSFNIIDLMKVGDYVNGLKITSVDKTFEGNILIGLGKNFGFSKFDNDYKITSVVTHEQMEQMAYKVGE